MFDRFFDSNIDFFKSLLIVATLFLLTCFYARYKYDALKQYKRNFNFALYIVAALAFFSFINMGFMHYGGGYFHGQEVFNRYMGAKYFNQVGYRYLYEAILVADNEGNNSLKGVSSFREQQQFKTKVRQEALDDKAKWQSKFTKERWAEFKADVEFFEKKPGIKDLRGNPVKLDWWSWWNILNDFGLEPSPAWVMVASFIANIFSPSSPFTMHIISSLDFVLFALAGFFLARSFGINLALFTFIGFFTWHASIYSWAGSSFLKFDWLALSLISLSLLKEGKFRWAGVVHGAACLSSIISCAFILPLLVKLVVDYHKKSQWNQEIKQFFYGFGAATFGLIILSLLLINKPILAWEDFIARGILLFNYWNIWEWSVSDIFIWAGEVGNQNMDGWQAKKLARFESLMPAIFLMKAGLALLIIMAISKLELWESFSLGAVILFVFFYITQVNSGFLILLLPLFLINFRRPERLYAAAAFYSIPLIIYVVETFQKNDFFIKFLSSLLLTLLIGYTLYVIIWREKKIMERPLQTRPKRRIKH